MIQTDLAHAFNLMKRANKMGIRISLDGNELNVKFSKDRGIQADFLNELKLKKGALIDYFRNYQNSEVNFEAPIEKANAINTSSGRKYHEVPFVFHWWLNESQDAELKQKVSVVLAYKITGDFNLSFFKQSLQLLLNRHESLRATFHKINEQYSMCVEPADSLDAYFDCQDTSDIKEENDNYLYFKDVQFNLEEGPLFLVRLQRANEKEYFLSFKLHHVIYDGWSIEILLRELLIAYDTFSQEKIPVLPTLKFQYKDYMSYLLQSSERYSEDDKKYWNSIFKELPPEISIPGRKCVKEESTARLCQTTIFQVPIELTEPLFSLSKHYSTSLYVVFLAALKSYLYEITGQNDISIATLVFGRDRLKGAEDQIGLYSKMSLIRTILDDKNTFKESISKVKKSYQDLVEHTGYPLLRMMGEKLSEVNKSQDLLLKVALFYTETNGYIDKSDFEKNSTIRDFQISSIHGSTNEVFSNIELMLDILKYKDKINLRVTYGKQLFDPLVIQSFIEGYFQYLKKSMV